jgi:hypothetical protein
MLTQDRYRLHQISTLPLAKFGSILGAAAMVCPSLLCALGSTQTISALKTLLEQWRASEVDVTGLGIPVEFDFITLLGLETAQALLVRLDEQRLAVVLMLFLGGVISGGLFIAGTVLLLGWIYNLVAALSGGLELELRIKEDKGPH